MAALGLAHELNLDVVIEGVETDAQFEMLKGWGARIVQGYLFSRPQSAPAITSLLRHPYLHRVSFGASAA
jgi:EAL domain-containing protein (putative c-di-GMP-specific phosphodiesterase class I)